MTINQQLNQQHHHHHQQQHHHHHHRLVVHSQFNLYDIYIGPPNGCAPCRSENCYWSSPFLSFPSLRSTVESVFEYERWLLHTDNIAMVERVKMELRGKTLGCWCAPGVCHGDVLARVANESDEDTEKRRTQLMALEWFKRQAGVKMRRLSIIIDGNANANANVNANANSNGNRNGNGNGNTQYSYAYNGTRANYNYNDNDNDNDSRDSHFDSDGDTLMEEDEENRGQVYGQAQTQTQTEGRYRVLGECSASSENATDHGKEVADKSEMQVEMDGSSS